MEDYFHKGRLSSALLRWDGDALAGLYVRFFSAEPERWMAPDPAAGCRNAVHGDQVVIDHLPGGDGLRPRFSRDRTGSARLLRSPPRRPTVRS